MGELHRGNISLGTVGEKIAEEYLREQGFVILARNYRYHRAEVDLVAEDGDELVFVEVKTRDSTAFGEPEESVTFRKEQNIRKAAQGFCLKYHWTDRFYRFDIISIRIQRGTTVIKHIRNAF